ncbi:MAG TPA: SDR family NAD(P)-dependent oxidoreductase [Demequinaceae bacterium]
MAWALVTGASVGLGAEFARQIAAGGRNVVLVSRDAERLGTVARELEALGVEAEVVVADLAKRADVARVARRIASEERPVDLLVNNAGFGFRHGFLEATEAELDDALDVMVRAVMILSQAAARAMVRRGSGTILNVSSIAAVLVTGTYSAHKAWVSAFTEALAGDLYGTGVTATAVCPGLVRTKFHERAALDLTALPRAVWLDAPTVVTSALRAARRRRVFVTPTVRYGVIMAVARILPRRWVRRASRSGSGRKANRPST